MISVWFKKVELTDSLHCLRIKWLKWNLESPVPFWNHHPWMCSKALGCGSWGQGTVVLGECLDSMVWEAFSGKGKEKKEKIKIEDTGRKGRKWEETEHNCCLNMWPKPAEEETEVYSAVTSKAVKTEGKKPVLLKNKKNCP